MKKRLTLLKDYKKSKITQMINSLTYTDIGKVVENKQKELDNTIQRGRILSYDNQRKVAKVIFNPQGKGHDWKTEPSMEVVYDLLDIVPSE